MDKKIKVCLVGSSGGHLTHLYMLKPFWKDKERFWVTFDKEDARSLLKGEKFYPAYYPSNRSIKALIINFAKREARSNHFFWCSRSCSVLLVREDVWSKNNLYRSIR